MPESSSGAGVRYRGWCGIAPCPSGQEARATDARRIDASSARARGRFGRPEMGDGSWAESQEARPGARGCVCSRSLASPGRSSPLTWGLCAGTTAGSWKTTEVAHGAKPRPCAVSELKLEQAAAGRGPAQCPNGKKGSLRVPNVFGHKQTAANGECSACHWPYSRPVGCRRLTSLWCPEAGAAAR